MSQHTADTTDYAKAVVLAHRAMLDIIDQLYAGLEARDSAKAREAKNAAAKFIDDMTKAVTEHQVRYPDDTASIVEMLVSFGPVLAGACLATRHETYCPSCAAASGTALNRYLIGSFTKLVETPTPQLDG